MESAIRRVPNVFNPIGMSGGNGGRRRVAEERVAEAEQQGSGPHAGTSAASRSVPLTINGETQRPQGGVVHDISVSTYLHHRNFAQRTHTHTHAALEALDRDYWRLTSPLDFP